MTDIGPSPRSMVIEEFLPLLGEDFIVDSVPDEINITLVDAKPLRASDYVDRPPFLLIFRSAPDVLLMAGHYSMESKGFGPDLIYISQTSPPPGYVDARHYYQAIFN